MSNSRHFFKQCFLFGIILSVFASFYCCANTFAITTIPKSKYKIVATFPNDNYMSQGGVITDKYYVFTDCGIPNAQANGGKTHHCTSSSSAKLHVVDRKTCKQTTAKITSGYLSGTYHKWGTNKVTLFGKKTGCMEIKNGAAVNGSGCDSAKRISIGISTGQGASALFNGYYYSIEGTTNEKHPIAVFRSKNRKKMGTWQLAEKLGEPEQISVDGNTGEVFISYNKGHKFKKNGKITQTSKTFYVKIDASVFEKYTGINKTSADSGCDGYNKPKSDSDNSDKDNSGNNNNNNGNNDSNNTQDNTQDNQDEEEPEPDRDEVPAEEDCAILLKGFCGTGTEDGQGILGLVKLVVNILTAGLAVLATIGIIWSGFMILMARDNEAQVAKAKKRIVEIAIGLVVWGLFALIIGLILPGAPSI